MTTESRVLIVDDQEFIRKILARIVSREGYDVGEAKDGAEAIAELGRNSYDFVISDMRMPNVDGVELAAKIRTDHPDIRILLVTAYPGEYCEQDALAAGADCYITKPFKNTEIAHTLATLNNTH